MLTNRASSMLRITTPFRVLVQRFALLVLIGGSFGLMFLEKAEVAIVERIRVSATDAVAPILDAVSRPAATLAHAVDEARGYIDLRHQNALIVEENTKLKRWHNLALHLEAENRELRNLLNLLPSSALSYVSARVISDSGNAFVRSILINAGKRDGIKKGQVAITGDGLVGRVGQVGDRASRVLLLTDLNSRIPVVTETSRQRAILSGDNTDKPFLLHLPDGVKISAGERVVTSGYGGAFPPGIPVGRVLPVKEGEFRIQAYVNQSRLEFVRVMEFGLIGILPESSTRPLNK